MANAIFKFPFLLEYSPNIKHRTMKIKTLGHLLWLKRKLLHRSKSCYNYEKELCQLDIGKQTFEAVKCHTLSVISLKVKIKVHFKYCCLKQLSSKKQVLEIDFCFCKAYRALSLIIMSANFSEISLSFKILIMNVESPG